MLSKIGPMEILIVLIIALLVFGPKTLPKLGRSIGQTLANFKKGLKAEESEQPAAEKQESKKTEP